MIVRSYSFRYDPVIRETLMPWRDKLGNDFDTVVSRLTDRDRQIEDYLNLTLGQGVLDLAIRTTDQAGLTSAFQAITGLTATVTVPAHRQLRITVHGAILNTGGAGLATVRLLEDGVNIGARTSNIAVSEFRDYDFITYSTPAAGTHTYSLTASITDTGTFKMVFPGHGVIQVEDIGPAQ